MEPTLHDGDIVVVREQEEVETGEIAIVLVNGEDATIKELEAARRLDSRIWEHEGKDKTETDE